MIGTRWPGSSCARIARVAAKPSMRGIRQSIRTAAKPWPAVSGDRVHAVGGDLGVEAGVLEHAHGDHLVDVVVLDHEDPPLRAPGRTGLPDRLGRAQHVAGRSREARREAERAAAAGLAVDGDPTAHGADQLAGDGETEAGAAVPPGGRGVGLGEGVEEPLLGLARDARAGVGHRDQQLGVARPLGQHGHRDPYLAAVGELHGVGPQVGDHLAEPGRVAAQERRAPPAPRHRQREPLLVGQAGEQRHRPLEHRPDAEVHAARAPACRPRSWRSRGCR